MNYRYIYDEANQNLLRGVVKNIEEKVQAHIQGLMKNTIFKIVVNNISYLRSRKSIIASFIVVLDPRISDLNRAENLLGQFNFLIDNNYGFNNIKIMNEPSNNSSLLANLSSFACKKFKFNNYP